jgi:hypothetical protein
MAYRKKIVCLAASRRLGGQCIAGRVINGDGGFGEWIRPVANGSVESISSAQSRNDRGQQTPLLDILTISFEAPVASGHQVENHRIEPDAVWQFNGRLEYSDLGALIDTRNTDLWLNGSASKGCKNNRFPDFRLGGIEDSLRLIKPKEFSRIRNKNWNGDTKTRGKLIFNGNPYILDLTCVEGCSTQSHIVDEHVYTDAVLCISLTQSYEGNAYKLIAGVMLP